MLSCCLNIRSGNCSTKQQGKIRDELFINRVNEALGAWPRYRQQGERRDLAQIVPTQPDCRRHQHSQQSTCPTPTNLKIHQQSTVVLNVRSQRLLSFINFIYAYSTCLYYVLISRLPWRSRRASVFLRFSINSKMAQVFGLVWLNASATSDYHLISKDIPPVPQATGRDYLPLPNQYDIILGCIVSCHQV